MSQLQQGLMMIVLKKIIQSKKYENKYEKTSQNNILVTYKNAICCQNANRINSNIESNFIVFIPN